MRNQQVEFLEFVEDDLRHAHSYYDSWQPEGGGKFQSLFRDTIAWIEWNPEMFPKKHRIFRRAIIRKSYFAVFFAIEPTVTTVVAVLDMRQNPAVIRRILRVRKIRKR